MCLDTTETAVFPEPLSSPAGGQECECEWVCLFAALCVCVCVSDQHVFVFTRYGVHRFNKLTGPRSTICLSSV